MTRSSRRAAFLAAGCIAAACAAQGAKAQATDTAISTGPSLQLVQPPKLAPTQAIDAAPVERFFGDWGGLQNELQPLGINIQFNALTEFAGNVTGGTRQGATFANQVGFSTDINWERLAGVTGLSTHTIIVNRSGSSDSR